VDPACDTRRLEPTDDHAGLTSARRPNSVSTSSTRPADTDGDSCDCDDVETLVLGGGQCRP